MPEQQNIEYKQSWHNYYLKWVCGFANAVGGKMYIGKKTMLAMWFTLPFTNR